MSCESRHLPRREIGQRPAGGAREIRFRWNRAALTRRERGRSAGLQPSKGGSSIVLAMLGRCPCAWLRALWVPRHSRAFDHCGAQLLSKSAPRPSEIGIFILIYIGVQ